MLVVLQGGAWWPSPPRAIRATKQAAQWAQPCTHSPSGHQACPTWRLSSLGVFPSWGRRACGKRRIPAHDLVTGGRGPGSPLGWPESQDKAPGPLEGLDQPRDVKQQRINTTSGRERLWKKEKKVYILLPFVAPPTC